MIIIVWRSRQATQLSLYYPNSRDQFYARKTKTNVNDKPVGPRNPDYTYEIGI